MSTLPTGVQHQISSGRYGAVVTEVGATLRSLTVDGEELLWTFAEDGVPRSSQGRQLVPWPNRIRDGRYSFDGVDYQLPITEVPRNNAIHGLGAGMPWRLVSHAEDEVILSATVFPQAGWAGVLEVTIGHRLSSDGLAVSVEARNVGSTRMPYGYGAHPYIKADLASTELGFTFTKELTVTPERLLPVDVAPLTPEHDFRRRRPIGDAVFDTALTAVEGPWRVEVVTGGRTVTFWADETLPWGQVFTPPKRHAIAVEPMTCGPDAFNEGPTHADLIVLEPGERTHSAWGISVA